MAERPATGTTRPIPLRLIAAVFVAFLVIAAGMAVRARSTDESVDVATSPTWSRQRTLLIGAAAHATSPHAGQGASLALDYRADSTRVPR